MFLSNNLISSHKILSNRFCYLTCQSIYNEPIKNEKSAVSFIKRHEAHGNQVYVHCRAGHGRSAAVVIAWLMYKNPEVGLEQLNRELRSLRDVRKTLWRQPNILKLQSRFLEKGPLLLDIHESAEGDDENGSNEKDETFKTLNDL